MSKLNRGSTWARVERLDSRADAPSRAITEPDELCADKGGNIPSSVGGRSTRVQFDDLFATRSKRLRLGYQPRLVGSR